MQNKNIRKYMYKYILYLFNPLLIIYTKKIFRKKKNGIVKFI